VRVGRDMVCIGGGSGEIVGWERGGRGEWSLDTKFLG
jgi:hypothetical protein